MAPSPNNFGLTGGIASGKSTVAGFFTELGARVVDADQIAHEVLRSPGAVFQEVMQRFGAGILDRTGEIDRRKLGAIVFADEARLHQLNAITHPAIKARINEITADLHRQSPGAVILVDAALMFESGSSATFRKVVVAWCRPEQQIERLISKSEMSREQAERRIAVQMPAEEKRRRADFVVDCSGTLEETRAQTASVYSRLEGIVREESTA
ncbi:MAG: dephospho-CoA kinase [Terriglobia bacterium]